MQSTIQQDRPRSLSSLYLLEEAQDRASLLADGFSAQEADDLARCAEWTGSFPLQKVRKRHRVEAICPMLAPSIQDRGLHFSLANPGKREPDLRELDEILREASDCFENEVHASDPRLRCLVLVLPGVRGGRLLEATEPTRQIKNELLERGILVGEFFPSCPFATTFNPKLFALRSPVPMYVLRTFIESDWRFICQVPAWNQPTGNASEIRRDDCAISADRSGDSRRSCVGVGRRSETSSRLRPKGLFLRGKTHERHRETRGTCGSVESRRSRRERSILLDRASSSLLARGAWGNRSRP